MYRERSSRVPGAVVWTRSGEPYERDYRIVPDGCLDLIWYDDVLLVAGPDTRPHLGAGAAGGSYTGLRFAPGIGPTVLGMPAHALTDQRVPLADMWTAPYVRELTERLATAADPGRLLESAALGRLADALPPDPVALTVVRELRAGHPVAAVARSVGYSERQLRRRAFRPSATGPRRWHACFGWTARSLWPGRVCRSPTPASGWDTPTRPTSPAT